MLVLKLSSAYVPLNVGPQEVTDVAGHEFNFSQLQGNWLWQLSMGTKNAIAWHIKRW